MLRIDRLQAEADVTTLFPAWDELARACRLPYDGSPRVWAGVVPELVTRGASNRLSPANKERLKSLTGRSKESSA